MTDLPIVGEKFSCKTNPRVKVEVIDEAEYRLGETKWTCVVYRRGSKLFVRRKEEFNHIFQKIT